MGRSRGEPSGRSTPAKAMVGLVTFAMLLMLGCAVWWFSGLAASQSEELSPAKVLERKQRKAAQAAQKGLKAPVKAALDRAEVQTCSDYIQRGPPIEELPSMTMVIPYLQESWFHIETTLRSVLTNTNDALLGEILMIDDGNPPESRFTRELEALSPKVRIVRNEQRQGLTRSKVRGVSEARHEVIFFFEPHCTVEPQWAEPLLQYISENPMSYAAPHITNLDKTMRHSGRPSYKVGGFDWKLKFEWFDDIQSRNRSWNFPDPFPNPILSGGIFAVRKETFEVFGAYDTHMSQWGGEHIETGLRVWQCGGTMVTVPCSSVAHYFRATNPYPVEIMEVHKNLKRAALWMDDRAEDFYRFYQHMVKKDVGDLSARRKLKKRCGRSMAWYIENVFPEYERMRRFHDDAPPSDCVRLSGFAVATLDGSYERVEGREAQGAGVWRKRDGKMGMYWCEKFMEWRLTELHLIGESCSGHSLCEQRRCFEPMGNLWSIHGRGNDGWEARSIRAAKCEHAAPGPVAAAGFACGVGAGFQVPDMNSEFLKDAEARIGAKPIWAGGSAVNPVTIYWCESMKEWRAAPSAKVTEKAVAAGECHAFAQSRGPNPLENAWMEFNGQEWLANDGATFHACGSPEI